MLLGNRKLILGCFFIAASALIAYCGIRSGSDLVGLATMIGAMAGGTFGVVWGNLKEHQANNGKK